MKRYREILGEVETVTGSHGTRDGAVATLVRPRAAVPSAESGEPDQPAAFTWRGRRYRVTRVLGHWREEEGWWRRPDGEPIRIRQTDLWRVEAVRQTPGATQAPGIYELASRDDTWRLDRVWD